MDLALTNEFSGIFGEDLCIPVTNTHLFEKIKELNRIKGIFVGHDHNNDFQGLYDGILLSYGKKTGFGSYGPVLKGRELNKGAKMIDIIERENEK